MNINDIITESQHACPHCGGPVVEYSDLMEKKDACYYKVKASAKVWPSAYASGRLVQCRKKGAGNYGNKSESVSEGSKDSAPKMGSKEKKLAQGALKGARDMSAVLGLVRGKDGVAKPPETKKQSVAEGEEEDAKFTPRLQIRSRIGTALDQYLDPEKVAGAYTDIRYYKHDGKVYVEVLFHYTDGQKIGPRQRKQFLVNKDFTLTPIKKQGVAEGSDQQWVVTVGTKTGGTSHTMTFSGTKEQAIKQAVARFGTSKNPVVTAKPKQQGVAEDKGMTQYNAFKREWRAKHGSDAKVPGYDSKEYNAYWWRQGDKQQDNKKQGVSEGARQGEYGRVLTALGLYYPEKFSMEELNTPDWHRVIANKADVSVEYAGQVIDDFTQPDDDEYNDEQDLSTEQQFDMIEDMVEHLAETHGVDSDEIWEDFESVDDHELYETAAWRRKEGKSARGGLNAKGVASYRRENPGSKLQTAVTTKPSKLKPGSKAAKRRKSFCARMGGVKGPMKKPNGKPTRKALALRKWNC
jgi:hypothetical protein